MSDTTLRDNVHKGIHNQYLKSLAAFDADEKMLHLGAAFLLEDAAIQFTSTRERALLRDWQEHECTCTPFDPEACPVCKAQNREIPL